MDIPVKSDRTVKILLALIALALFANLLRPSLTPLPAQAAPALAPSSSGGAALALEQGVNQGIVVSNGTVYEIDWQNGMKVVSQARLK